MRKYLQASFKPLIGLLFVIFLTSCATGDPTTLLPSPIPTIIMSTATPTPQPKELWGEPSYSPNGEWIASHYKFSKGDLSFLSFTVEKTDGSAAWEIETIPIENKPPYSDFPAPLMWSQDGRTFYFINQGFQDGCLAHAASGWKFSSLNLENGNIKTIIDEFASEIRFSPDESKVAYLDYGDIGLQILNLETGDKIGFEHLYPDIVTDQYGLVWAPDNNQLAFTILLDACISDKATTIVIVDLSKNSQRILIKEDENHLYTKEWVDENRILVTDWSNDPAHHWYLNPNTAELTLINP